MEWSQASRGAECTNGVSGPKGAIGAVDRKSGWVREKPRERAWVGLWTTPCDHVLCRRFLGYPQGCPQLWRGFGWAMSRAASGCEHACLSRRFAGLLVSSAVARHAVAQAIPREEIGFEEDLSAEQAQAAEEARLS